MKKALLVFSLLLVGSLGVTEAQTLSPDSVYKQRQAAIQAAVREQQKGLAALLQAMPEKADSVNRAYTQFVMQQVKDASWLAVQYAPRVPEALDMLYRARNEVPKDTLRKVLALLDRKLTGTAQAVALRRFVACEPLREGDALLEFPCTQADGTPFDWSVARGKQVLLLYGGLGCMRDFGRRALKEWFDSTSRDDLLVIVYEPCASLEELRQTKAAYPFDYIYVSDFQPIGTPMQVEYGAQATPTCFLADRAHIIRAVSVGLDIERFRQSLEEE